VKISRRLVTLCSDSYTQSIVSSKAIEAISWDYDFDKERFKKIIEAYK
jgi:hypothetical protein